MTFADFVKWLASSAALGVLSSILLDVLKVVFPSLKANLAKYASVILAAVVSIVAQYAVTFLPQVPPWVEQIWPVIIWIWSQVWYEVKKSRL